MSKYSVSLEKVVNDLSFQVIYTPKDIADIYITAQDVNRPGLILTGFEDYFDPARIQFIGLTELEYFKSLICIAWSDNAIRNFSLDQKCCCNIANIRKSCPVTV